MLRPGTNICQCGVCREFFTSPTSFDKHRAGPPTQRRCLSNFEMRQRGMAINGNGYWTKGTRRESPQNA